MGPFEIACGAFATSLLGSLFLHWIRRAKPRRRWNWERAPRVRFLEDVRPEIVKAVVKAMRKAELLGARLDGYCYGGPPVPRTGEIVITMIREWAQPDHAGLAVTHIDKEDGLARWSVMQLPMFGTTDRIALHELLHCFGFSHVGCRGHVLSATSTRQGDELEGVSHAFHEPADSTS